MLSTISLIPGLRRLCRIRCSQSSGSWCGVVAIVAVGLLGPARTVKAETFRLTNGGQLEGDWLNRDRSADAPYQVRTTTGTLVLSREQVRQVIGKSETERAYEVLLAEMKPTVEAHWDMAERCLEAGLTAERRFHLEAILELDPDHEQARQVLGFQKVDGRWVTREELLAGRGLQRHNGAWRTAQEIELLDRQQEREAREVDWKRKVRMWRSWIVKGRGNEQEAFENIRSISDVAAAPALTELLKDDAEPTQLRRLYIQVLGPLADAGGNATLINLVLYEPVAVIRDDSLNQLEKHGREQALMGFLAALKHEKQPGR